jgi:hypothetical protein
MPNPQEPEMNDPYLLDLNRLSKHRLEMLLTNKQTPDQILLVAVNNMSTIGRGLIIGSDAEEEINTVEEIFTIANWIASNPKAKNSMCESIVNQLVESIDEFDEILDNQIPIHEKLYLYFVAHRNEEARSYIASQSDLPDRFLQQLALDSEWLVRSRIAQRENLPEDLVNLLAGDIDNDVRSAIMNNYDLTDDRIRKLVNPSNHGNAGTTDLHDMVEFSIVQWTDLPPDVVATLSKHKCSDVRLATAKRQYLASDIVGKLLEDRDEDVRNLIESRFDLLSTHPDWNIRWKCAFHEDCPIDILRLLKFDETEEVRLCAARRLGCSRKERNQYTEKVSPETQIVPSTVLPGSQLARMLEQSRLGASRNSHSGVSAVDSFLPFMRRQFARAKLAIASIIRFRTS